MACHSSLFLSSKNAQMQHTGIWHLGWLQDTVPISSKTRGHATVILMFVHSETCDPLLAYFRLLSGVSFLILTILNWNFYVHIISIIRSAKAYLFFPKLTTNNYKTNKNCKYSLQWGWANGHYCVSIRPVIPCQFSPNSVASAMYRKCWKCWLRIITITDYIGFQ